MKHNKILFLLPLLTLLLSSCNDMWEEKTNSEWEPKYAWEVARIAQGVLYNAYSAIENRPDSYGSNFLDAATDNALTSQYSSSVYALTSGKLSSTNNPIGLWNKVYTQFQYINLFLENGLTDATKYNMVDPDMDASYKTRLKGEAFFLRAYWGFRMLQMYGGKVKTGEALGYPLALHFMSEEDAMDYSQIKRNTYQECAEQIMLDCDTAAELLPASYAGNDPVLGATEIGRATKIAAMALKSIVALYAASPAYQSDDVISLTGMGQFSVLDEEKYKTQWEFAALEADKLIKTSGFGEVYGLKSTDLADAGNTTPSEFIFRTYHNTRELENRHFPPYYFGKANTIPSQNLVDAFPMKNGYPISDVNSDYDPNNPYEGRDNRFYLNIYYHGATFGNDIPLDMVLGGKDSPTFDPNASRSGYYLAKFLSKNHGMLNPIQSSNSVHYNPIIRKAEIFLNYAEAANEAWGPKGNPEGCKFTAYDVIKAIRKASGGITDTEYLDAMAENKDDFRKLIQNERRIELAFENYRYFDLRRTLLPLNEAIRGVEVSINEDGTTSYNTQRVLEPRKFDDVRYYYAPIPRNECIKNPNLINNLGW